MGTRADILEELRLMSGRPIVDAVFPPLLFAAVATTAGPLAGAVAAVSAGLAVVLFRLVRGRPVRFAAAGFAGTLIAAFSTVVTGREEFYFAPGILAGFFTGGAALLSVVYGRPMAAWTSRLVHRWPLAWYRHPQVRPAYREVTLMWAPYFVLRSTLQLTLAARGELELLTASRLILGWPALLVLLIASYVYGTRRLAALSGPSVEEFRAGTDPPWTGQRRGF